MAEKTKNKKFFFLSAVGLLWLAFSPVVLASEENGVIDDAYRYVWGENIGWLDFKAENGNVQITDSALSGYVWGENVGWISLNCSNEDSCTTVDFGVVNDGEGNLSGYAWGENVGWINFSPDSGGVNIDGDGNFSGYAFGENVGWLIFGCETTGTCGAVNYGLKTDWRPADQRWGDLEIDEVEWKISDDSVVIKWETNRDADGRLRWGEDRELKNEKKEDQKEEKHKMKLKNLQPNTRYYFRIKSTDENGMTDRSKIYSVKTDEKENLMESLNPFGYQKAEEKEEELLEELEVAVEEEVEFFDEEEEVEEEGKTSNASPSKEDGTLENSQKTKKTSWLAEKIGAIRKKVIAFQDGLANLFERQEKVKNYFTTRVFQENGKKKIAQVRFQILDKEENPLSGLEATLFSEPQTTVTDENGIALFTDIPVGKHHLVFAHEGEEHKQKVEIKDTQTENGLIRAEVIEIVAGGKKVALWMWLVICLMVLFLAGMIYFGRRYFALKKFLEGKKAK